MSFWGGLFGGSNPTVNKGINQTGQIAGFSQGLGESNLGTASGWWKSLLSGDQAQISKALGPEFSAIQKQGDQQKKTTAMFGNRSGGNNAANQNIGDKTREAQRGMVSSLLSGAASSLANTGGNLLSTALSSLDMQEKFSQDQMENWSNSILGRGLTQAASYAESYGLNSIPGAQ